MAARVRHRRLVGLAAALGLVACGGGRSGAAQPLELRITAPSSAVAVGQSMAVVAKLCYRDGSLVDVTDRVVWQSSAPDVAVVGAGQVLGVGPGVASVTAAEAVTGLTAAVDVTVTEAVLMSLQVMPTNPSIALGTARQFTATGIYSDASVRDLTAQVVWASSAPGVASIAAGGLANGLGVGSASISATDTATGIGDTTTLTVTPAVLVSVQVTPTNPSIALGTAQQFAATGTYSDSTVQDLTSQVAWTSSAVGIASIGAGGLANGVGIGPATITATHAASGISDGTTLTVTPAVLVSLQVTPTTPSIALGTTQQFAATGTYSDATVQDLTAQVIWSSSAPSVATVSNAGGSEGLATGVAVGPATITATHAASAISDGTTLTVTPAVLVSLQVTPTMPSIALGTAQQFTATGTYSDATVQDLTAAVTWSSSAPSVATVSNAGGSEGLATSVAVGAATITATHAPSGISGGTTLTVTPAVLVSLQVTPTTPSIALGTTQQFTATGTYSDATVQDLTAAVTWSSSAPSVATVSNAGGSEGLATSVAVGAATITATHAPSGISGGTTLTVTPAVLVSLQVTPTTPSIALGTTQQFTATGTYSDATVQDLTAAVTWSSSAPSVATVSNAGGSEGLATSVAVGAATITATHAPSGISDATTLTVTPAVLVSLQVTPTMPSIALGTTQQFTATGTYSDATVQDLTAQVAWTSSASSVATISNLGGSQGRATSAAVGSTTITATHAASGISGATTLTVTPAVLVSLQVTPTTPSIALGTTQQFTATGTYSDATVQDLTAAVTWSSSAPSVATVSNAGGSEGLATGVAVGGTTITATHAASGLSGATTLAVFQDIAFRSAASAAQPSALALTIATPAGTAAGDVMLAAIAVRPSSATITPPSGWALVRRSDNATSVANSLAVYVRVAVGGEPASHTWTLSTSTGSSGGIATFTGVDTSNPVDVHAGQATAFGLVHAAPSVTTTVARTMLFTAHCYASSGTWTPPAGMTEVVDVASEAPGSSTGIATSCNYEFRPTAGATGARAAVASANDDAGNGIAVALRRAP